MSRLTEPFGFVTDAADEDDEVHGTADALDLVVLAGALGLDVATLPLAALVRLGDNEAEE